MDILRITARWSGFTGGPGYSNFHFTTDGGFWDGGLLGDSAQAAADGAAARVTAAFGALREQLPSGVRVDLETEAEIMNSDTGEIVGFAEVEPGYALGAGGTGGWSAASGAVINWRTNDYRSGRRIRGRTFMVPMAGSAYQDDGTLSGFGRSAVQDFGAEMLEGAGGAEFGVWSRPRNGAGGVFATVTGYSVPDMAAVLRSRRD